MTKKTKIEIEVCGHKIIFQDEYSFKMLLDEFCYYLHKEKIYGMGCEDDNAGFIISDKVSKALNKFVKDNVINNNDKE